MQIYAIALMINTEIFIPLVLSRNNFIFNHAYIYIILLVIHYLNLKLWVLGLLTGNACVPYHAYIYMVNYPVCYILLI